MYANIIFFLLKSLSTTALSLPPTGFSLFHHSVQLFFLPLSNRAADAEPGPHSKTAGVRLSQLINTQNYLPPPKPHFILLKHAHRKTERQSEFFHNHFIKYTLTAL